jgi:hypothetical protein
MNRKADRMRHDCMDAGGRATQEAKAEGWRIRAYREVFTVCLCSVHADVRESGTFI